MSNAAEPDTVEPVSGPDDVQPDPDQSPPVDLPPVEPPSAGFIIQLFVVPGLIVLAVVGIWAMFGQLAAGEQDWTKLVAELSNNNEHRRWRGAHGLAQMLQADQQRKAPEQTLTQNPVIVGELTQLLSKELAKSAPSTKDLKFQEFLARTLGVLDSPDKVFPVLREAMRPDHDKEVRKNAILSVALIADRINRRKKVLNDAAIMDDLIENSGDDEPLIRQVCAYTLGIIGSDQAKDRLIVMLDDADRNARLNAAVGLARNKSTAGISVFQSVLVEIATPFDPTSITAGNETERTVQINDTQFQNSIRLRTALQAIETLSDQLTAQQRTELVRSLEKVTEYDHLQRQFRSRASTVMQTLKNSK
jgi:hypothetical protein